MTKLRVNAFAISVDGYGAGPEQAPEDPLGRGGERLHEWFFPTCTFQRTGLGNEKGTTGVDDDFAARGFDNVGAWIMGRNMFGPVRGPWADHEWKGWWGPNPPYHVPVFVLTHHPRPSLEMEGGTVFHFVTDGIHAALEQAREAAGGRDVRLGGGVATIRQYLEARLIDEMHLVLSPVLLGRGEHLLAAIDLPALGYQLRACPNGRGDAPLAYTLTACHQGGATSGFSRAAHALGPPGARGTPVMTMRAPGWSGRESACLGLIGCNQHRAGSEELIDELRQNRGDALLSSSRRVPKPSPARSRALPWLIRIRSPDRWLCWPRPRAGSTHRPPPEPDHRSSLQMPSHRLR